MKNETKSLVMWSVLLNFFNVMDLILTYIGINYFGARELNPLFAPIILKHPLLAIAIKLGLVGLITWRNLKARATSSLKLCTWMLFCVCMWNIGVMYLKWIS